MTNRLPISAVEGKDLADWVKTKELSFIVNCIDKSRYLAKVLVHKDTNIDTFDIYNSRKQLRVFRSLEAIYIFCKKIGLDDFKVHIDK